MIIFGHVYTIAGLAWLAAVAYGLAQNKIRERRRAAAPTVRTATTVYRDRPVRWNEAA
ncbi:hypothetical protein IRT45_35275 [Nocardia sp. BSTN01]|uniref:hypothetical protein n=1 Tax=Nocardia sp. BSTN01 TaxID=2783665 RepID=UPI00188F8B6F|nr:hypothetical protein [Nocardia sp. BSTN01]MBF5002381.1 hypothetical protein [Nocardia sp. BSTN01]